MCIRDRHRPPIPAAARNSAWLNVFACIVPSCFLRPAAAPPTGIPLVYQKYAIGTYKKQALFFVLIPLYATKRTALGRPAVGRPGAVLRTRRGMTKKPDQACLQWEGPFLCLLWFYRFPCVKKGDQQRHILRLASFVPAEGGHPAEGFFPV